MPKYLTFMEFEQLGIFICICMMNYRNKYFLNMEIDTQQLYVYKSTRTYIMHT